MNQLRTRTRGAATWAGLAALAVVSTLLSQCVRQQRGPETEHTAG